MDLKSKPVYGTHCMKCDKGQFYLEDEDLPESCPVCGEHKEFTILRLESLKD
jgi:rubrerythrin